MALDMESEFYKLAHGILGKPNNLYKMAALGPTSGRVTLMGADGFVVIGKVLLQSLSKGPEPKAYRLGLATAKEMFGNLLKEFDEEIERLPSKKLLELGRLFASTTGWGNIEIVSIDEKAEKVTMKAKRTIELKYKRSKHHMLTCGFLAGIVSLSFRKDMQGDVVEVGKTFITFSFSR